MKFQGKQTFTFAEIPASAWYNLRTYSWSDSVPTYNLPGEKEMNVNLRLQQIVNYYQHEHYCPVNFCW